LSIGHSGGAEFSGVRLGWRVVRVREWKQPARQQERESFDADSVGQRILLRHWRAGDRFQPIGLGTSVKLQDLFTNHKVARAERSRRIVAEAETGEVFWVQGFRIGERFKVRPDTRNQLLWRWNCS
jgi:tRNA(Ile)-lysidine synthase